MVEKRHCKLALSQHQEKTDHRVSKKPVMVKMKVVDNEPRKTHNKVTKAIEIKLR